VTHQRVYAAGGTVDKALAGLAGTWDSGGPARLGWTGTTWHSYHPDGTLTSNLNLINEDGCRHIARYLGDYSGTADTLSITMRSGTLELAHCPDAALNVEERALTAKELAENSGDHAFSLDGDVLTFQHEGDTVNHQRINSLRDLAVLKSSRAGR
jgi:hypothetical protein